ncbi:pilin [Chromohalobacter salexigens]|nr:pilin [Chromohalobacter salexigens]
MQTPAELAVQEGETDVALSDLGLSDSAVQNGSISVSNFNDSDDATDPQIEFTFTSEADGGGQFAGQYIRLTRQSETDGSGGGWQCTTNIDNEDVVPDSCDITTS